MPDEDLATRVERLRRLAEAAAARAGARTHSARGELAARPPDSGQISRQDETDIVPIERLVTGQVVQGAGTACFVRDSVLPLDHRHGRWPLALALEAESPELSWLGQPAPVSCGTLARAIFLDVETTGLAGGTGTLAFLVGAAWFEAGSLVLAQYLMRSPDEEPALLGELAARVRESDVVVSFNGKAFDVPLLETRYTLRRQRSPFPPDHLDLLAGSRRIWRLRLASCKLSNLEQSVLGVQRWDDVPGFLIPQLYTDYLRTGDGRGLAPVFDHNALDVLSLVTLAGRLAHLHRDPLRALEDDPVDLVALGRSFEPRRRVHGQEGVSCVPRITLEPVDGTAPDAADGCVPDFSGWCYQQALAAGASGRGAELARMRLAVSAKRRGDWAAAEDAWRLLAATAEDQRIRLDAIIELAKSAEHRRRDLTEARRWVREAEHLVLGSAQQDQLARRARRLDRKAGDAGRVC